MTAQSAPLKLFKIQPCWHLTAAWNHYKAARRYQKQTLMHAVFAYNYYVKFNENSPQPVAEFSEINPSLFT